MTHYGQIRKIPERLLLWLLLPLMIIWLQWGDALIPKHTIPGDYGDSRLNMILLENSFQSIKHLSNPFQTNFYFPYKDIGGFSDIHLGSLPVYAVFRLLGLGTFGAMQAWIIAAILANFCVSRFVMKRLRFSELSSQVGAAIFTFAAPVASQASHLQLLWRWFIPVQFFLILKLIRSKSLDTFLFLLGISSIGLLTNSYLGTFAIIWIIVFLVGILAARKLGITLSLPIIEIGASQTWVRLTKRILSVGAIALCLITYINYFVIQKEYHFKRTYAETLFFSPKVTSWLTTSVLPLWKPIDTLLPHQNGWWENQLFPGVFVLACLLYLLFSLGKLNIFTKLLLFNLFIMMLLFTSSEGFSGYLLFSRLPGLDSLRVPGRIILVLLMPIALLCSLAIEDMKRKSRNVLLKSILTILVIEMVTSTVPISSEKDWFERPNTLINTYQQELSNDRSSPILVLPPMGSPWNFKFQLDGMVVATKSSHKTFNGYTGFDVHSFSSINNCIEAEKWVNQALLDATNQNKEEKIDFGTHVLVFNEQLFCSIPLRGHK